MGNILDYLGFFYCKNIVVLRFFDGIGWLGYFWIWSFEDGVVDF